MAAQCVTETQNAVITLCLFCYRTQHDFNECVPAYFCPSCIVYMFVYIHVAVVSSSILPLLK